jgi:hypothetical protein
MLDELLKQLIQSAEVADNIEAEKQRKAEVIQLQRKALDKARSFA